MPLSALALTVVVAAVSAALVGILTSRAADRALTTRPSSSRPAKVLVVTASLALVVLLVLRLGLQARLVPFLALAVLAVPLALVDITEHRLPNRLVLVTGLVVGTLLVVAALLESEPLRILGFLAGGVGLFSLYLLLALVGRGGIGMGDVKLAAVVGATLAFAGWRAWLLGMLAGFVLNGFVAFGALALRRTTLRGSVPFGPSMLLGALLTLALL